MSLCQYLVYCTWAILNIFCASIHYFLITNHHYQTPHTANYTNNVTTKT